MYFNNTIYLSIVLIVTIQFGAAFFVPHMPFPRYMDDSRTYYRQLVPMNVIYPEQSLVIDESIPPLPTPLPMHMSPVEVPRRPARQFSEQKFKRLRPCYYSPIQCLIKRSAPLPSIDSEVVEQTKLESNN
ncbi:hypothetical protein M3Y94_00250700 [Aphelenchoides besseyi]|nr:hypothetical protein M3Y94_00250700 [Aphelenchoides besseyi]KAI6236256.1 hypothetical protein M3Y95_00138100 [Aphelenchoides besseyi]